MVSIVTGETITGPESGWGKSISDEARRIAESPLWVDLAHVTVINVGRTAVSVWNISLDFGRDRWWKPRSRYTVTGKPLAIGKARLENEDVRLEPGESASVVYDVWPLIQSIRKTKRGNIQIRGSAAPAGKHAKKSPVRQRWKISPDEERIWPYGAESDETDLYVAVWRAVAHLDLSKTYDAWLSVAAFVRRLGGNIDSRTSSKLEEALRSSLGETHAGIAIWGIFPAVLRRVSGRNTSLGVESDEE